MSDVISLYQMNVDHLEHLWVFFFPPSMVTGREEQKIQQCIGVFPCHINRGYKISPVCLSGCTCVFKCYPMFFWRQCSGVFIVFVFLCSHGQVPARLFWIAQGHILSHQPLHFSIQLHHWTPAFVCCQFIVFSFQIWARSLHRISYSAFNLTQFEWITFA